MPWRLHPRWWWGLLLVLFLTVFSLFNYFLFLLQNAEVRSSAWSFLLLQGFFGFVDCIRFFFLVLIKWVLRSHVLHVAVATAVTLSHTLLLLLPCCCCASLVCFCTNHLFLWLSFLFFLLLRSVHAFWSICVVAAVLFCFFYCCNVVALCCFWFLLQLCSLLSLFCFFFSTLEPVLTLLLFCFLTFEHPTLAPTYSFAHSHQLHTLLVPTYFIYYINVIFIHFCLFDTFLCLRGTFLRPLRIFLRPLHTFLRPLHTFLRPLHTFLRPLLTFSVLDFVLDFDCIYWNVWNKTLINELVRNKPLTTLKTRMKNTHLRPEAWKKNERTQMLDQEKINQYQINRNWKTERFTVLRKKNTIKKWR